MIALILILVVCVDTADIERKNETNTKKESVIHRCQLIQYHDMRLCFFFNTEKYFDSLIMFFDDGRST